MTIKKIEPFTYTSSISTSAHESFNWHEQPGALERLTPPWQKMEIMSQARGIQPGVRVKMKNTFFGVPIILEAEHMVYEKGLFFQDTLIKSPFSHWVHSHSFFESDQDTSVLEDKIEYRLPFYFPWFMKNLIQKELKRIFAYRHTIFVHDILRHKQTNKPLNILISGASGVIGSALIPFFTTGGHTVYTLVRRKPDPSKNEIFWDPKTKKLDLSTINQIDIVINLNGAPLSEGRWTNDRKKILIDSRVETTRLLAETIAHLENKPSLFFSSSAIGYYGNREDTPVVENEPPGYLFISELCKQWEDAAMIPESAGIRTVIGRIGVVLTSKGGALAEMLPTFSTCLGSTFSKGKQTISWISLEDTIGCIWHLINNTTIAGPVNIVAPNPVSNSNLSSTLAKILKRPALLKIPAPLIKLIWGQMGEEILLSGVNVKPEKLLNTGFHFQHNKLEEALRATLGR